MVVWVAPQGSAQNENLGWCLESFQALHLIHRDHSKVLQRCTFPAFSWGWAGTRGPAVRQQTAGLTAPILAWADLCYTL